MKNTKVVIGMVIISLFTGCASTSESSFSAPDGSTYKTVKCSQNSFECLQKSSASCPSGKYKVVSSESHAGGVFADIFPGPVTWYSMTYTCGISGTEMPTFPFTGQKYTPPVQHNVNVHHSGSVYNY